jgi:23S rRNA pseudouridine2605 synthase
MPDAPDAAPDTAERIAKRLSRAGVASRREAERMIAEGRVAVNGKVLDTPAVTVTDRDRITVDGKPLAAPDRARLWLYHKPEGLVTSASDEKGRDTVFDHLPEGLPRVMPVGRLDLTSEGLLLLTNDGELKRRLELPATGWLRKYRVRVNGRPTDAMLEPLRRGITVEGERFQPMTVTLDRSQGANAWLTVSLREGRNREIRRAMVAVGLYVNRLIRTGYGPFRLGDLGPGAVEEVKSKVLRDQLGLDVSGGPVDLPDPPGGTTPKRRVPRPDGAAEPGRDRSPERSGDRPTTPRPRAATAAKPAGKPEGKPRGKPRDKPGAPRSADPAVGRPADAPGGKASGGKASGGKAPRGPAPGQPGGQDGGGQAGSGRGRGGPAAPRPRGPAPGGRPRGPRGG